MTSKCSLNDTTINTSLFFDYVEVSYNQPKLPGCSTWSANGVPLIVGHESLFWPTSIFVDRNNTVYVTDLAALSVREWRVDGDSNMGTMFGSLHSPGSLFVKTDGTVFVDDGGKGTVKQWKLDRVESTVVMNVESSCYGLFVDIIDNLYCSLSTAHQVVKQRLDTDGDMRNTIVAGNGICGSDRNMLCKPWGIFVTVELDLYVADCRNNRVQWFQSGQLTGKQWREIQKF